MFPPHIDTGYLVLFFPKNPKPASEPEKTNAVQEFVGIFESRNAANREAIRVAAGRDGAFVYYDVRYMCVGKTVISTNEPTAV